MAAPAPDTACASALVSTCQEEDAGHWDSRAVKKLPNPYQVTSGSTQQGHEQAKSPSLHFLTCKMDTDLGGMMAGHIKVTAAKSAELTCGLRGGSKGLCQVVL